MSSKLLKAIFLVALLFLFTLNASAATIIIYGEGGLVLIPPKLCPIKSTAKCAEVILDGPTPQSLSSPVESSSKEVIVKALDGNLYNATLAEPLNLQGKEKLQGKDVKILNLTPIK